MHSLIDFQASTPQGFYKRKGAHCIALDLPLSFCSTIDIVHFFQTKSLLPQANEKEQLFWMQPITAENSFIGQSIFTTMYTIRQHENVVLINKVYH